MISRRLSLPGEHGAYLTIAGAAISAALVAPRPGPALAVMGTIAATFLARGPIDRAAARLPLRSWDGAALALGAAVATACLAWSALPIPTLGFALGMLAASWLCRRRRLHRDPRVELVALGGLGASAGLAAFAGGAAPSVALAVAALLGTHAATSVLAVRPALGKRGRLSSRAAGAAAVVVAGVATALLGHPWLALAFAPRLVQLAAPTRGARAMTLGLRETAALAVTSALLALLV